MSFLIRYGLIFLVIMSSSLWASVGKVSLVKGEAFVQRDSGKSLLQNGTSLEEKDVINTSKNAQIQLIFEDKTVITLGGESQFKIEEYLNDAVKPKAKFKFGQGTFKSITGSIGKVAPENFTLETKTATIGIRGTIVAGSIPPPPPPNFPPPPELIFCLSGTITATSMGSGLTVMLPAGTMSLIPPGNTPPTPPRQITPQDLNQLNQNLGGVAPPPPPPAPTGDNQPQSGNTPPTSNPPAEGGNTPPPPTAPQGFTPTVASGASQTNSQNSIQNQIVQNVADDLGIPAGDLKDQLQNQICPSGTSGTFPDCIAQICPTGTTGTFPDCVAQVCPTGTTGTFPDCVAQVCPTGTTGTFPNCVAQVCPTGTTGTFPNCVAQICPTGTTGTFPNCVAQICPTGTTGTFPNCTPIPSGGGGSSTPPSVNLDLVGLATSTTVQSNTIQHTQYNEFAAIITNTSAEGQISFFESIVLPFSSTSINPTSPTLFTVNIADTNITQISSVSSPISKLLWGKWTSLEMDNNTTLMPTSDNYWVAGKTADKTAAASHIATIYNNIDTYTNYTYLGKSMGTVYNFSGQSFAIDPVNDATNEVKLVFQFGNAEAPIAYPDSHIRFTANGYWDITTYSGAADASENGTFWAMLSGTGAISGSMNGAFYGANAESLGGTFKATNLDTTSSAIGAFVASKDSAETSTSITGLATSTFIFNSDLTYSSDDNVMFDIINLNAAEGNIILNGHTPSVTVDLNTSATSLSSFGTSSSDVYWGKWTSTELENNNTLIASADNFWIAGIKQEEAATYISALAIDSRTPILTYTGNVMGSTYASGTRYAIDESLATNKVQFQFNLGESVPIDTTNSFITFVSNGGTWLLKPGSGDSQFNAASGTFSNLFTGGTPSGDNSPITGGYLKGTFYGSSANTAGGTFQATSESNLTALGVFKTIKTSEFYYPSSFSPTLDTITTDVGSVNFTGFATSEYTVSNALYLSSSDTLNLTINTNTPSIAGSITYAGRSGSFVLSQLDLALVGDDIMTYTDRKNFVIKDFVAGKGYMVTDNSEPIPNDYVSWGYWAVNSQDSSQLTNSKNYWVAGDDTNASLASTVIAGLIADTGTHSLYTYNGNSIGYVQDTTTQVRDTIDPTTNNAVVLDFDFGGGAGSLKNTSYIQFQTIGDAEKIWKITPSGSIPTDGTQFSVTNANTLKFNDIIQNSSTSVVKGKFYGDQAQAVGGTFNAATATAKAVGVFKAKRLGAW